MALRQVLRAQIARPMALAQTSVVSSGARVGSASTSAASASAAAFSGPLAAPSRVSARAAVCSGVNVKRQVRCAHLDTPDFGAYKRPTQEKDSREADYSRRAFTYLLGAGSAVAGAHLAKSVVQDFLDTMSASADVLALAKMEVELDKIPEGKNMTFKWRGKPVFVRHRPQSEIDTVRSVDVTSLRHKQSDEERTKKPEWLVVLGICTHLGCVPIANAGEFGGYFCPCHGSHYDASGRIRKGPAPENLEVPEHSFKEEENKLVIG